MAGVKRNTKKATGVVGDEVVVEEVKEPETKISSETDEQLFVVKLDSKRFEGRSLDQVLNLVTGSVGVVSKITIERE